MKLTYEQATARCWAEIDLRMLRHNLRTAREENPGVRVIPVLKADAYGLGAARVARALADEGADMFAVAEYTEAAELREVCGADILVMGHTSSPFFDDARARNIILTAVDGAHARAINAAAAAAGEVARVHIKLDTGLHRLGFAPEDIEGLKSAFELKNLKIEGMFTHLALRGRASDAAQMRAFYGAVSTVRDLGFDPGMLHALDSIGMLVYPEYRLDAVRVGAWIYGSANRRFPDPARCPLAVTLKARITQLRHVRAGECLGYDDEHPLRRDSLIATVGCGYYDGVPRACANGFVVVNGVRAPIVGLVMMDQLTVDVTDVPGVKTGDAVTFLGDGISLLEASGWYNWNRNELIARMSRRVQKIYIE